MLRKWQALTSVLSLGTSKGLMVHRLEGVPGSQKGASCSGSLPLLPKWARTASSPLAPALDAPREKEHILLPVDSQHTAPLTGSLFLEWMKEECLEKEEELGEYHVTENKGGGKTSATARRKRRTKSKKNNNDKKKKNNLTTKWSMLTNAKPQREKWWGW